MTDEEFDQILLQDMRESATIELACRTIRQVLCLDKVIQLEGSSEEEILENLYYTNPEVFI